MNHKAKKSFGLIETLIACAILIIIAGAVLALNIIINNNLQFTRERSHAYYRAAAALEAIRNIRDTNYIDGDENTHWNSFVCNSGDEAITKPNVDGDNNKYRIVQYCTIGGYENRVFVFLQTGVYVNIKPKSDGVEYDTYLTFEKSGISPDLEIDDTLKSDLVDDNSIKVIATVEWNSRGRLHKIELKEVLTNWKQAI